MEAGQAVCLEGQEPEPWAHSLCVSGYSGADVVEAGFSLRGGSWRSRGSCGGRGGSVHFAKQVGVYVERGHKPQAQHPRGGCGTGAFKGRAGGRAPGGDRVLTDGPRRQGPAGPTDTDAGTPSVKTAVVVHRHPIRDHSSIGITEGCVSA